MLLPIKKESVKKEPAKLKGEPLTPVGRKVRKLKRDPKQFLMDSNAYIGARKTAYVAWAKLGSFALVLIASIFVVFYYTVVASPRYASESQFVVKQASNSDVPMLGLAALGTVSSSMRDALILQKYIESREMAMALDAAVSLKAHYERSDWDSFSKLASNSSAEDYIKYYQEHVLVSYDEMSDVLLVETQTFDAQYSLTVANTLLQLSELFINNLGAKMAQEQMAYAQKEVERSYEVLSKNQNTLIDFQDKFELYNPEQKSGALATAINGLEGEIITQQTELKSLLAFMRNSAPEVTAKRNRVDALKEQLAEEKTRLTNHDKESLNKINVSFKEIKLNTELALDLYKSSLVSLESVRAEAYKKLKHLLVIERPALAQEDKYPARLHSILTWFVCLLLMYFIGRLLLSIVKEHKE
ncbi:MAG: lipopolysaccharide biosynthesis protein [Colwellia sp.]|jgi:Capsule polysaccharide export protein